MDYWHKQKLSEPLFPDLLWSRPENKRQAGKLLVIGGNSFGFAAVGDAYRYATDAGAGLTRVLLPLAVKKVTEGVLPDVEFGMSTPSGSFAKTALGEWLEQAAWADSVLLAGDFGRNSETAQLMETFIQKYSGQLVITQDAVDYFRKHALQLLNRPETCVVLSFEQLQKLAADAKFTKAFTFSQGLVVTVEILHEFTTKFGIHIVTKLEDTLIVASDRQVSTTKTDNDHDIWRVKTAAQAAVWWLQNPDKPYEALTTAALEISK